MGSNAFGQIAEQSEAGGLGIDLRLRAEPVEDFGGHERPLQWHRGKSGHERCLRCEPNISDAHFGSFAFSGTSRPLGAQNGDRWTAVSCPQLMSCRHHASSAQRTHHGIEGFLATSNGSWRNTTIELGGYWTNGFERPKGVWSATSAERYRGRRPRLAGQG